MYIVYCLRSVLHPEKIYIGFTTDLEKRLSNHNAGTTEHTTKYKPWKCIVSFTFENKDCAIDFEKYLKSGSGRAFIAKRFLSY
jgi:putative endonuclease